MENYKVADNSCECCRIAISTYGKDEAVVFWRHIFPGSIRDHASAILKPNGESSYHRATIDNWKIEACPHHGRDIVSAEPEQENTNYHAVWFTNGDTRRGIYYALQNIEAGSQSQLYLVDGTASASHPQIARQDEALYIAWKFFDGEKTSIRLITSLDEGKSWLDEGIVLSTQDDSDHPILIESQGMVYLGWHTLKEGYRVKAI